MQLDKIIWTEQAYRDYLAYLSTLSEESMRIFNQKLIPDTPHLFGIRTPKLREVAKQIAKGDAEGFLRLSKGGYHEELIVEGLVMAHLPCDYPNLLRCMRYFAGKIYNWAICDTVSFKRVKQFLPEFWLDADSFLESRNPWAQRFGLGNLMQFYLTDDYIDGVLSKTESIHSDFYYVQMMQGWLIATAVAKQRDKTIDFLKHTTLETTAYNMAIKKARESLRISAEDKALLLCLKR
jgi:3-methyladenine DNA glycosylase AlkD